MNSENLGPYGDAITYELIPEIEEAVPWDRAGLGAVHIRGQHGWLREALAVQVFYPDEYNGCYAACPDPVDFHHYTTIDIYNNKNAYYVESAFKKTPRPGERDYLAVM